MFLGDLADLAQTAQALPLHKFTLAIGGVEDLPKCQSVCSQATEISGAAVLTCVFGWLSLLQNGEPADTLVTFKCGLCQLLEICPAVTGVLCMPLSCLVPISGYLSQAAPFEDLIQVRIA